MALRRPRTPAAEPGPPRGISALEYYGAKLLPDLSGWWVYALGDRADGHVFYTGQSENVLSRLRDWSYAFKDQYDPARVYLIGCRDEYQACVRELEVIDHYQPERNSVGRADELRARIRSRNAPSRNAKLLDSGKEAG